MLNVNNTKAVVEKLFGKTLEEQLKYFQRIATQYKHLDMSHYPFGVHVTPLGTSNGVKVDIGFKSLRYLLSFTLELYPACCGSRMFHHFSVSEPDITQEQLDEIMNAFIYDNRYDIGSNSRTSRASTDMAYSSGFLGGANRIEVMMVERRLMSDRYNAAQDIEPVDNPTIYHKMLWNYFHKHAKRVRTRLEYNPNSGNVLHNMEVCF